MNIDMMVESVNSAIQDYRDSVKPMQLSDSLEDVFEAMQLSRATSSYLNELLGKIILVERNYRDKYDMAQDAYHEQEIKWYNEDIFPPYSTNDQKKAIAESHYLEIAVARRKALRDLESVRTLREYVTLYQKEFSDIMYDFDRRIKLMTMDSRV